MHVNPRAARQPHRGHEPTGAGDPLELTLLYRGTLSSCNYACSYCPFAKHWESAAELRTDRQGLDRFRAWVAGRTADQIAVFFTPWGEALVRSWYRRAIVELSRLPQVTKIAVQTNLSCKLGWLRSAEREKLGLWCTFHPGETSLERFLDQCRQLVELGVKHSVGCVGLAEHLPAIEALRRALPAETYLWINAYKSAPNDYDPAIVDALQQIDPLFAINNTRHESRGKPCRTGHNVVTVDSSGDLRRCHFVDRIIGNLYDADFRRSLALAPCPNATCGCHIGYVHLEHLALDQVFGSGILERIPRRLRDLPVLPDGARDNCRIDHELESAYNRAAPVVTGDGD